MIRSSSQSTLVLIVDDDTGVRLLAREALQQAGFSVLEAEDGAEALDLIRQRQPILVLLDVRMPKIDGFTVCQELRRQPQTEHTTVIMLTALDDAESIDHAFDAGATDFITKPINWQLLIHRVRHLLRAAQIAAGFRHNQYFLANAQRAAGLGSWEWNTETGEMQWSDEVFRILGLDPRFVVPDQEWFQKCSHPDDRNSLQERIDEALRVTANFEVDYRIQLPDGRTRWVCQSGEMLSDPEGGSCGVVGTIQDVTEKWQAQEKIRYLANYDGITGLGNRHLFQKQLTRAIAAAKRRGHSMGLLYLDIDHFKLINDEFGHAGGDTALRIFADRLRDQVRSSDVVARIREARVDSEVSRLGGDEFAVILSKIGCEADAADVSDRVLRAMSEPTTIDGHTISIGCSVGIAVFPGDGDDMESLLRAADAAMYEAKQLGGGRHRFFSPSLNAARVRKLRIERDLREALERNELQCFELHFQPKVRLETRAITGLEALLRWSHPSLGRVPSGEFIAVAEKVGLIRPLGQWVFQAVCQQIKRWQAAGIEVPRVAVNASAEELRAPGYADQVFRLLQVHEIAPALLEFEITERALLDEEIPLLDTLGDLRRVGARIALDDFGAGYSTLGSLARVELDCVKIDRSLLRDIEFEGRATGLFAGVVSIAKNLDFQIVAEGVETPEQEEALRGLGCEEAQGYLYSQAVPADEVARLLRIGSLAPEKVAAASDLPKECERDSK